MVTDDFEIYIWIILWLALIGGCLYFCRKLIIFATMLYLIYYLGSVYILPFLEKQKLTTPKIV